MDLKSEHYRVHKKIKIRIKTVVSMSQEWKMLSESEEGERKQRKLFIRARVLSSWYRHWTTVADTISSFQIFQLDVSNSLNNHIIIQEYRL